jgi:hypothetical protein
MNKPDSTAKTAKGIEKPYDLLPPFVTITSPPRQMSPGPNTPRTFSTQGTSNLANTTLNAYVKNSMNGHTYPASPVSFSTDGSGNWGPVTLTMPGDGSMDGACWLKVYTPSGEAASDMIPINVKPS